MGKSVVPKSGLATASVNGTVIAEATSWMEAEGNIYFPPDSIKSEYFTETNQHSACPWKGNASYYTINAGGQRFDNAAWYYPEPLSGAVDLRDHVAFYKNKVEISAN